MSSIFSTSRSNARSKDLRDLEIELSGHLYPLRLRKMAQARSISVSADPARGEVRLTMPRFASTAQALRFAQSKSNWLADQFEQASPVVPLENGTTITFAGEEHIIRWSPDFFRKPCRSNGEIQVGGPEEKVGRRLTDWLKDQAREIYQQDLVYYCERAGVDVPKLSVGDARRRWGSCSGRKSIRLNWRLVMAPTMVRRSVVAHEVTHLLHMNHGKIFYDSLDSIFDEDRRDADSWLKAHGGSLYLVGAPQR